MTALAVLDGVSLTYPDAPRPAVADASFVLRRVGIVGPSGSGKSTLLDVLSLLDAPSSGSYRFAGEEVRSVSDAGRAVEDGGAGSGPVVPWD